MRTRKRISVPARYVTGTKMIESALAGNTPEILSSGFRPKPRIDARYMAFIIKWNENPFGDLIAAKQAYRLLVRMTPTCKEEMDSLKSFRKLRRRGRERRDSGVFDNSRGIIEREIEEQKLLERSKTAFGDAAFGAIA